MKNKPQATSWQTSLNTLAQNGTNSSDSFVIVNGEGSDLGSQKNKKGRAKRKTITNALALNLIDVVKGKEELGRLQTYWNTYHCQSKVYLSEGRLYGRYCKNRCCTLCLSIRKADIINRYLPIMETWEDPHFVTITARAVPLSALPNRIKSLLNGFRMILEKHRKRASRGKGLKLVGLKSIESNFNPKKKTYNPHIHLLVANRQMAEIIVREWLRMCPEHLAKPYAQKIERVWKNEKALMEVVKYGSKIFTEPDVRDKANRKQGRDIYAAALDRILCAMKGHRIFDRFGFNLPKQERQGKSTLLTQFEELEFNAKACDWIRSTDGERLFGYVPEQQLLAILENHINKDLE